MKVVDFAWQVIDMQRTIDEQDREITRLMQYEKKYHDLLDSSIESNLTMMGNVLELCMTPGVIEACKANRKDKLDL